MYIWEAKCSESGKKQRGTDQLKILNVRTNMITTLSTITTWHSQRSLEWYTYLGRFWDFNPQGPQQLRCWKWRLLFSVLHPNRAPGLLVRHCWRYRARARRKWRTAYNRKETITMQGCQSTPCGLALCSVTSHCMRIKTAGQGRLTWFKGD